MTKKNQNGTDNAPLQTTEGLSEVKDKIDQIDKILDRPYKDPLHFSYEDLTIEAGGRKMILNKRFLDQQNCWTNLNLIKQLFTQKFEIFEKMDSEECPVVLRNFDKELTELEFKIQEAFGFERNIDFHRFWERPKCECPQLDNQDRWGTKYHIVSGNCKLHGGISEKDNQSQADS